MYTYIHTGGLGLSILDKLFSDYRRQVILIVSVAGKPVDMDSDG